MNTLRVLVSRTLALMAVGLLTQDSLLAETNTHQTHLASYSERLASLEAELASLRGGGGDSDASCLGCGSVDCCCGPTWVLGYEIPYLQVNDGSLLFPGAGASAMMTPHYGQVWVVGSCVTVWAQESASLTLKTGPATPR